MLTLLLLPALASADVICVPTTVAGCNNSRPTVHEAVSVAANGDTIRIAAGNYLDTVTASDELTFEGAGAGTGPGDTVLTGDTSPGITFTHGGAVRSMRVVGGTGGSAGFAAVSFQPAETSTLNIVGAALVGGDAPDGPNTGGAGLNVDNAGNPSRGAHVSVTASSLTGGDGKNGGAGALLQAAGGTSSFSDSTLTGGGFQTLGGLQAESGGSVDLARSTVTVAAIQNSTLTAIRSRLFGSASGFYSTRALDIGSEFGPSAAAATVIDSLLVAPTGDHQVESAARVSADAGPASLSLRGSTVIAQGATRGAVEAYRSASGASAATASLVNTAARTEGSPAGPDLLADRATITADHSSFNTVSAPNGGSAPAAGTGTNLAGNPLFANFAGSDFSLQAGSPLIDRGDSGAVTAGELDLAGNPRVSGAAPDIGAFERQQPVLANAAPSVSSFGATNRTFAPVAKGGKITTAAKRKRKRKIKRGTRFRYTLSEAAKVAITIERKLKGKRVKKGKKRVCAKPTRKNRKKRTCTRYKRAGTIKANKAAGRQTTSFTGRFKGKALKRGRYRATLVATDAQGAKSKPKRLSIRIAKP